MEISIPLLALAGAIIVLLGWIVVLEIRIKKLLGGKDGRSLENIIASNQRAIAELENAADDIFTDLGKLDARLRKKLHGVKALRFNPFEGSGQGGNQSFAASFLDEEGNGVVLSSLYSRDKVSVYAKPIMKRESEFELSDEERAVLG